MAQPLTYTGHQRGLGGADYPIGPNEVAGFSNMPTGRRPAATAPTVTGTSAGWANAGNPYGSVPKPIVVPDSRYKGIASIYPGLADATGSVANLINSQIRGEFTPQTENALWDTANRFGVASGMPGAGLWSNRFMGNVAGAKENLQQQGMTNYGTTLNLLGALGDDPNLVASIANRNALMEAAPDPAAADALQYSRYLQAMKYGMNSGFNPGGGTRQGNPFAPSSGTKTTVPGETSAYYQNNPFAPPGAGDQGGGQNYTDLYNWLGVDENFNPLDSLVNPDPLQGIGQDYVTPATDFWDGWGEDYTSPAAGDFQNGWVDQFAWE